MKTKRWLWCALSILLIGLIIWTVWENQALMVTEITVKSNRLPDSFSGYRIALVSDLHNAQYGENNKRLLEILRTEEPDMIAVVGDLVDSRRTNFDISLHFMELASQIAPIYYVLGNHEARLTDDLPQFEKQLSQFGVTILRNQETYIIKNGQSIRIIGIDDPLTETDKKGENEAVIQHALSAFDREQTPYTLLLSHRPEFFDAYCQHKIDLALTGHNHGGLIRIPGLGGLYAGGQVFPEYDDGLFSAGSTSMVLSRGAGNSSYTFRINNRPEIVMVTLA